VVISFSTPVPVFDSLGVSHQLAATYTKTGTNTWNYDVSLTTGRCARNSREQYWHDGFLTGLECCQNLGGLSSPSYFLGLRMEPRIYGWGGSWELTPKARGSLR
jgi:hypothetical protein